MRKDYMRRLIAGIRKQIEEDPETIKAKELHGEDVLIGKWVDASLLCSVIEQEVLEVADEQ